MRSITAVLAAVAVAAMIVPAGAAPRTVRQQYVAGPGLSLGDCPGGLTPAAPERPNVGRGCFRVADGETQVRVSFEDTVSAAVAYWYYITDANGNCVGQGDIADGCPNSGFRCTDQSIFLPKKAAHVDIYLQSAGWGTFVCSVVDPGEDPIGQPTTGEVIARFT